MGYLYSNSGGLLCDICGGPHAIKKPCPFGWCQPIAACDDCLRDKPQAFTAATHRAQGCEASHNAFAAAQLEEKRADAAGEHLLAAAINVAGYEDVVQAAFRSSTQPARAVFMPKTIYDQRAGGPYTLSRFEALGGGAFPPAPVDFYPRQTIADAYAAILSQEKPQLLTT